MKVLHVETGRHLYGGAQQVLWLMDGLNRAGCESVLVCTEGSALQHAASERGIALRPLPCAGDLDLRFARRLTAVIKELQPDLLHSHSRRGADTWGGRAAARAGVPAVVSRRVDNHEAGWLARWRYRPYRKIVAISETIAEVLRDDGVDPQQITVIRSAVDAQRFAADPDCQALRQKFDIADGDTVLFCVAQFIPRKGHRFLLEAMAQLKPRYPNLRLLLFGQGPLEAELRALATNLGLGGAVQFAGFEPDLDNFLGCADLLVHPALTEGLGVAALKAAAAAVPVVAFNAGGLREAVVHEQTGLLLPPGETDALASGITALLDDAPRRRQLGAAGQARMQKEFTVAAMVDAHLALYGNLLND